MRLNLRLLAVAGIVVVASVATGVLPASVAGAACAEPTVTADPNHGKPDDPFTVHAKNFVSGCPSQGASGSPNTDIKIFFVQGSKEWLIGTVAQAGPDGSFSGTVYVPNGDGKNESPYGQAPSPGAATVRVEGQEGKPTTAFTVDPGPTAGNTTTTRRPTTTTAAGGATTTTRGATTTTRAVTTSTTTLDTTTTSATATSAPPLVTVVSTTTTSPIAAPPLVTDDDDDNRGPLIAVALVLLAAIGVTLVWRAYRGPAVPPAGGPWD